MKDANQEKTFQEHTKWVELRIEEYEFYQKNPEKFFEIEGAPSNTEIHDEIVEASGKFL